MKATASKLAGVFLLEPTVFGDSRGYFYESFNNKKFESLTGFLPHFVQDNQSKSSKGVLRGLHYQVTPKAQGKLVRVTAGEVFDVCVDLRRSSPTFGKSVCVTLSADNHRQLWIPPGFAHGFLVTSDSADFQYKTTDYYAPAHERSLQWNDPALGIDWPLDVIGGTPTLSFAENPDILAAVAALPSPPYCVGFAAESENLLEHGAAKRKKKNIPLLVGNIGHQTFGKDDNELVLFDDDGHHPLPRASKDALAALLVAEIARRL